jgi:hypothetical protein
MNHGRLATDPRDKTEKSKHKLSLRAGTTAERVGLFCLPGHAPAWYPSCPNQIAADGYEMGRPVSLGVGYGQGGW